VILTKNYGLWKTLANARTVYVGFSLKSTVHFFLLFGLMSWLEFSSVYLNKDLKAEKGERTKTRTIGCLKCIFSFGRHTTRGKKLWDKVMPKNINEEEDSHSWEKSSTAHGPSPQFFRDQVPREINTKQCIRLFGQGSERLLSFTSFNHITLFPKNPISSLTWNGSHFTYTKKQHHAHRKSQNANCKQNRENKKPHKHK